MGRRSIAHLAMVSGVAASVLALTVHLDERPVPTVSVRAVSLASALSSGGSPGGSPGERPGEGTGPPVAGVDESRPHDHIVDPETGGLVSVAPAAGVVPDARDLGPIHVDPLPTGTSVTAPIGTRALFARATAQQTARDGAGAPIVAGATAPLGTPGIRTLGSHVQPSCSGTGRDGNRVQVLYVREAGTASRYSAVLPVLRHEVANVDDVFAVSARETGGRRRVRWVHDARCLPVIGNVVVPRGALGSDFFATISALKRQGFDAPSRKYLVFADADRLCGIGTTYDDRSRTDNANDGRYPSYARVDAGCWSASQSVAAHELTHTLGGVLAAAPHATRNGHCYDDADLMCYDDGSGIPMRRVCAAPQEQLLDCRHDDYFSTAPAPGSFLARSWNTASSSFLDPVDPGRP